jgi:hypothetical protein
MMPIDPRAGTFCAVALLVGCGGDPELPSKSDDTGGEALDARAPWVTINLPDGGAVVTENSSVTLTGTIADYDSDLTTVMTTWGSATGAELCGGAAPGDDGAVSCTFSVSREDSPITLTANDGEFESSASIDLVIRTDDPPTVRIASPADGSYMNAGETITFEAQVEDDNDAPNALSLALTSDIDGTLFTGAADPSGDVSTNLSDMSLGDHTLTLTATDRDGFEGTATILFEVNSKPGVATIHIDPTAPGTNDDLQVVIDADAPDEDGDSLSYRYTWYADGVLVSGEVDATLPADETAKGQVWTVQVQATDGRSVGEPAEASTTIENTAPEIDEAVLTPDPADISNDLVCTAGSTTDADGDDVSMTYSWQVAGVVRPETGDTLSAGVAAIGNSVVCTIIPTDGIDAGAAVRSNTVVIGNALPTEPEISITPDISDPGTADLTCIIDTASNDADGETVTYTFAWDADGLVYPDDYSTSTGPSSLYETNDTVPAADTSLAEEWTCTVTPNDGTADGTPGTALAAAAELQSAGDGETASGSTATHDAYTLYAQQITLASDLTVTGFGVQIDALASSGTDITMGLYDDASGVPGSLLVETDQETLSTGSNLLDSTTWVDVSAGDYWLVVNYDAADVTTVVADGTSTATSDSEADGGVSTLPASWTGTGTTTEALNAWWILGY